MATHTYIRIYLVGTPDIKLQGAYEMCCSLDMWETYMEFPTNINKREKQDSVMTTERINKICKRHSIPHSFTGLYKWDILYSSNSDLSKKLLRMNHPESSVSGRPK